MARLFVGNLPFTTTEDELAQFFLKESKVDSVQIVRNPGTGRSKGFAFVDLNEGVVSKMVAAFNGTELGGRKLTVSEARSKRL